MSQPGWAIFDSGYADLYDLTTRHREDEVEVEALAGFAWQFCTPSLGRILDIGCGTGRHAGKLAGRGFDVFGLDPSDAMIRLALLAAKGPKFSCGTIEKYPEKDFRFAYSMGHVVNYLGTTEELFSFFRAVHGALRNGAGYYFECWGSDATRSCPPQRVVREFEGEGLRVRREVIPISGVEADSFELLYRMEVFRRDGKCPHILERIHRLKLFSRDMLEKTIRQCGFVGVEWRPALTQPPGKEPKFWGAMTRKPG